VGGINPSTHGYAGQGEGKAPLFLPISKRTNYTIIENLSQNWILVQNQGGREYQTGGILIVFRGFVICGQRRVWAKRYF